MVEDGSGKRGGRDRRDWTSVLSRLVVSVSRSAGRAGLVHLLAFFLDGSTKGRCLHVGLACAIGHGRIEG